MSKNKLKNRAICPKCNKGFNAKEGVYADGYIYCPDCGKTLAYRTFFNYKNN